MPRILSIAIVLTAEAFASVLLEKLKNGLLAVLLIIISVVVLALIVENVPEFLVRHANWAARLWGVRLRSRRAVHGYWFTLIKGDAQGGTRQKVTDPRILGGSILSVRAGKERFELEGETYMVDRAEWTSWSGLGISLEGNEMLFTYGGYEGSGQDSGIGYYVFHSDQSFQGGFYGSGLGKRQTGSWRGEYRSVTGERCHEKGDRRRRLLERLEVTGER
ncbi:MAG TPA: hypothetical protein VMI33_22870 [Streptosporangiaceae bacterium]|nr:hypothetical protein [Streptosporangiaceae bacterium]